MGEFQNKIVLVTGASSGIGAATTGLLLERGALVVLGDIDIDGCERVLGVDKENTRSSRGEILALDVTRKKSVTEVVEYIVSRYGRIDAVAHCAGICNVFPLVNLPEDEFDRIMMVNTKGTFLVLQSAGKQMLEQGHGSICIVASRCAKEGAPGLAHYCALKYGVVGLVQTAALEWASQGVRVNCVCPGDVDTPMLRKAYEEWSEMKHLSVEEVEEAGKASALIGRLELPEEIAANIVFLLSKDSGVIVGQESMYAAA